MNIITKKEAKSKGLKFYFTGISCKRGHIAEKYISGHCVECHKEKYDQWKNKYPEYYKERYETHFESITKCNNNWREEHPEYMKDWYEKYPDYNKDWRQNNPDKNAAKSKKYATSKLQRMPIFADSKKIEWFYSEAARLSKETNTKYVVDHIYPLQGKLISGLHVENNLQVITEEKNRKKSNKFEIQN